MAIELVLLLRLVFHPALRQAEGFVGSVLRLLGLNLSIPDLTTLSRRSRSFAGRRPRVVPYEPLHLLIDSTGLKLFGQGEWQEAKHGRARRCWRKLHIAFDAETGEIAASILTGNDADYASQVPDLLGQVGGEIATTGGCRLRRRASLPGGREQAARPTAHRHHSAALFSGARLEQPNRHAAKPA